MKSLRYLLFWLVSGVGVYAQIPVKDVSSLQYVDTRTLRNGSKIQLGGYYTNGDAGGGDLYWDSTSTATTNGGTVFMPASGAGRFIRDLLGNPVTPKMFGARADAVTPDDNAINAAKAYATSNNIATRITPGQYMVSNTVIWNTNCYLIIDPGVEWIRPAAATDYSIRVQPASSPTFTTNLMTDVREGNISIYVYSTNGYRPGDFIVIGDQSGRDPGNTAVDAPNQEIAQILRIETNRFDLVSHVRGDYRLSNTNQMARIGELDARIYGFKNIITTNNTTAGGIFCNYVTGGWIHEADIEGNYLPAVHFQRSTRVKVTDCAVKRGTGVELGGIGYSYYASRSSDLITFDNCTHEGSREAQVDSGARDIDWTGCRAIGPYDDGFNVHGQACKRVRFLGCTVNESRGYGILVSFSSAHTGDSYVDIIGCKIRANLSAIYVDSPSTRTNVHVRVLNNELQGQRYAIEVGRSGYGLEIGGNKCTVYGESFTGAGMLLTNTVGATIYDNSFYGYLSTGVYLSPGSSNNVLRNTTLRGMLNNTAMEIAGNDNIIDGVEFQESNGSSVKDSGANNKWTRYDARNLAGGGIGLWFNGAVNPTLDGFSFVNVASAIMLTNLNRALIRNGQIVAATNSTNPFKDYANNTRLENVRFDGTLATNANDTAIYNVSGTNKTYVGLTFSPAAAFDNCIYSESGVSGVYIQNSVFEDGCVARIIGGAGVLTRHVVQNCTFRNTPAYVTRPNGMNNCAFIDNIFENTPVWGISAVNGGTNVLITGNKFRAYNTTNATLFPNNNTTVVETANYYGTELESFLSFAESTNGWPTSIPTNSIYVRPVRKSGGMELWAMRSDGVTLSSNVIFPIASTSVKVDGVAVTDPDFGDTTYTDTGASGSSVTVQLVVGAVLSNLFTAGSGIVLDRSTGTNMTISSTGGGGATNGTAVYSDSGVFLNSVRLNDNTKVTITISGTNATWDIASNSLTTNDISSAFYSFITNQSSGSYTYTNGMTNSAGVISANIVWSSNLSATTNNGQITVSAVVSTNSGTVTYVDAAGPQSVINFQDNSDVNFTLAGTNINANVIKTNYETINIGTLNLTNRLTTNVLTLSTSPVIVGRTLGGSGVAQELTLTGAGAVTIYTNAGGIIVSNPVVTSGGSGNGTNVWLNNVLMQPAKFTNNTTGDAGRVLWYTNAAGDILAYATNLPAGGGGSGTNILFVSGIPVTNANLVSSANATVSATSVTNITYTFTGVGSATNGYLLKSSTQVGYTNSSAELDYYTFTVPGNTLSEDGDELEIYIPGKFITYTGTTNGYIWRLYVENEEISPASITGNAFSAYPFVSSSFAVDWRFRIKRVASDKWSAIATHMGGADDSSDTTNVVTTVRYTQTQTMNVNWSDACEFKFTLQFQNAHTSLGADLFGYTALKLGSAGGNTTGSGASIAVNSTNITSLNLTNNEHGDWVINTSSNVSYRVKLNNRQGAIWSDGYQWGGTSVGSSLNPFGGVAIASGTVTQQGGETNHPGIVRITSAAGANSGYYFGTGTADVTMDAPWGFIYTFRIVQTNDLRFFAGGLDSTSTSEPTDGWYLDNQYGWAVAVSAAGGARSYSTTSNQLSTNTWYTVVGWVPDRTQAKLQLFNSDTGSSVINWTISSPGAMTNTANRFGWGITTFRTNTIATALLDIDWMGVAPVDTIRR